ncbi:MAG: DUF4190 domain-containing protein [Actinobacteria bacterium]|nr:DUF4190 domain-containing protein [Actinomycetota bacterium]
MGLRFNPPPGWPPAPAGFVPPAGWRPDPAWPPAPADWPFWVEDDDPGGAGETGAAGTGWAEPEPSLRAQPAPAHPAPGHPAPGQFTGQAGPGTHAQFPGRAKTSGFAIASFVLGLLSVVLLSVIFGIAALVRIRRRGQRGKGFAIAGLALSGAWVLVLGVAIAVVVIEQPDRSAATGQIAHQGTASLLSLRPGDCFQNPAGNGVIHVRNVTAVPCSTAHNAQVFAIFPVNAAGYPGRTAMLRLADRGCRARIARYVDRTKLTGTMSLHFVFPEPDSWAAGRRSVSCLIVDSSKDLTSSLLR